MSNLAVNGFSTGLPVITITPEQENGDVLIPLVLRVLRPEESAERDRLEREAQERIERERAQQAQAEQARNAPQPIALPEAQEVVIRSRLRIFTSAGMRIRAIVDGLRDIIDQAPPEAAVLFAGWSEMFAQLPRDDRQSHIDALAMLVAGVIRPIMLSSAVTPEAQDQTLLWDEQMEEIFRELWADVVFADSVQEWDRLLRQEENTQALCTRQDRTNIAQNVVAGRLIPQMGAQVDEAFTRTRQHLINLQNVRQELNRDVQVDALVHRTEQVAQNLFNQTTELAELSRAVENQAARHYQALRDVQNLLERPI